MLRRLLKYDMRSIARTVAPMFAASGIVSVICCGVLYFTYGFSEETVSIVGAILLTSGFYIFGILAITALWVITAFVGISRYYKSLFTDEGYLNMVLPIKTRTLFNAKLITTFVWVALATVVSGACVFIALYLPTVLYDPEMISIAIEDTKQLFGIAGGISGIVRAAMITELIGAVLSFICNVVVIITAVTVGAVLLQKRRVMSSIMFYLLINLLTEGIVSFFEIISGAALGESLADVAILVSAIFSAVLSVAVCVGMYFVNLHLLEKKFNIE